MARTLRAPSAKKTRSTNKAADPTPTPAAGGNVTAATRAEMYEKCRKAKEAHEEKVKEAKEANAIYRATLKDAKKAGINPDTVIWRLQQRFRTPEEIDAETRDRNEMAKATNLPLGTQLGLFADGRSVATKIEDNKLEEKKLDALEDARFAGQEAGKRGDPHSKCQYEEGSPEYETWMDAWSKEQKAIALNMGREPVTQAAH